MKVRKKTPACVNITTRTKKKIKKSIAFKNNKSIFYFPRGKLDNPVTPAQDCLVMTIETEQQQSLLLFKWSPKVSKELRPNPFLDTSERDKTIRHIKWNKENKQLARERVSDQMKRVILGVLYAGTDPC